MQSANMIDSALAENSQPEKLSFAQLYDNVHNELYRFCLYFTGNSEDAKDITQETAIAAYKSFDSLRNVESFKAWIFKIAYRKCKHHVKSLAALKNFVSLEMLDVDITDGSCENLDDALHITDALQQLSNNDRRLILLSLVCGYKSFEIAKATGKSDNAVRTALSRAVAKLRTILEKE